MDPSPRPQITQLLLDWSSGDPRALPRLLPLVYEDLRRMAQNHLRHESGANTLQRTALVHEAYLRLVDQERVDWRSRAQFFALASQMMRRVLIDHARRRRAAKRGGGAPADSIDARGDLDTGGPREPLDASFEPGPESAVDLLAVDHALSRLERLDPRQGRLVELRFFGGLSLEESAEVIGVSPATAKRDWIFARAWLQRELRASPS